MILPALLLVFVLAAAGCNGNENGQEDVPGDEMTEVDPVEIEAEDEETIDLPEDTVKEEIPPDLIEEDITEEEEMVELTWTECDTSEWPLGYPFPPGDMECTIIEVPLNHDEPGGERIQLTVGRQKARLFPTGKAIFNFAGGPGGTSVGQSGTIPVYLPRLRDTFDLVYVDQRGTGGSGYMDCPGGYPETRAAWEACADAYGDYDLNHYLTVDAAHDIDLVRRILGYDDIYLRGGSYGTRMALEYMRQYPEHVAVAVLDGIAPPDIDLVGLSIASFDVGVDLLVQDCEADTNCLAVSPTLEADLIARREEIRATPRPIIVDGSPTVENEELYLIFLEAFLYTSRWRYRVPRAIHDAAGGDNSAWNRMMSEASGYTITDPSRSLPPDFTLPENPPRPAPPPPYFLARDYIAPGILITVICAEWFPNSGGVEALRTIIEEQTWGNGGGYIHVAEACAAWDVDPIDAALRQPVTSDLPTLLLSGEIDLNTWPEWGERAAGTLSDGSHFVVPYASHSTISVTCAARIMSEFFLFDGRIEDVDASCLESISHPAW